VSRKLVGRVQPVAIAHDRVTRGFRENRRGGNRCHAPIAANYGLALGPESCEVERRQAVTVNKHRIWPDRKPENSAAHRQHGRMKNIQRIDFRAVSPGNRPRERRGANFGRQRIATGFRERLRIGDAGRCAVGPKHNGRGNHRSGKRAATRLVDAGNDASLRKAQLGLHTPRRRVRQVQSGREQLPRRAGRRSTQASRAV
jgi:hypothetical protein